MKHCLLQPATVASASASAPTPVIQRIVFTPLEQTAAGRPARAAVANRLIEAPATGVSVLSGAQNRRCYCLYRQSEKEHPGKSCRICRGQRPPAGHLARIVEIG